MQREVAQLAVVRYGVAVLCVTAVVILALALRAVTVGGAQLLLVAILITGSVSGLRPALVACVLATVAYRYYFSPPFDSLRIGVADLPRLMLFMLVAGFMATMSAARRRAENALKGVREDLEVGARERTADLQRTNERLQLAVAEAVAAQQRFRDLVNSAQGIVWEADATTLQFSFASNEAERILGYPVERWLSEPTFWKDHLHPDDREWVVSFCEKATGEKRDYDFEYRMVAADGSVVWLRDLMTVVLEGDRPARLRGVMVDVTELKRAEQERQARRWFMESMDRVNRAIQGTSDLEQMMSDVLDAALSIFDCDRAWLVYPCDPEARSYQLKMQRTRAEFPGLYGVGVEVPIDPDMADVLRTVRASSGPARFGPGSQHPLPADLAKRLGVQSRIVMALYPKGDQPYMCGLSQCAYPRVWTSSEERLFQEIGRRLEDALTSLLMFRSLGESERRLQEAQRISHVGYWERDLATNRYTWSDENYRIFGLRPQERMLTFDDVQELLHPADREMRAAAVAEAVRGGRRFDVEYRVVRPDGEVRFVRSQGDVVRDESGRPLRVFGTVQDITERKRDEHRRMAQHTVTQILSEATTLEEATPKIFQAVYDCLVWDVGALWRHDREAGVLRCVEVWHPESLAVPEFEAASRESTLEPGRGLPGRLWSTREPAFIPDVVHDPDFLRAPVAGREGLHAALGIPILLRGEVLGVMEFFSREVRQPDRELINVMASIGSQIGQFIERKRAEDALHRAQAELAHVTRVATLGELTASIAHEINQPLAAVVADASASLNWLAAADPDLDMVRDAMAAVVRDGHRAADVIQRIRQLVTKTDPQRAWVDVNDVIRDVLPLVRSEVRGQDVAVRLDLAPALRPVLGDRVQLQQVVINLVMNGIEAMARVDDRLRELVIRSRPSESDQVLVAVEDAGVGVDPARVNQLFDAFFTTKPGGMGMGLSISRSIIEGHGGRLWATPNPTHGATFHFVLPGRR